MSSPPYAAFFSGWPGPWEFADPPTTARRLRAAGFVDVETRLEPAPVFLPNADEVGIMRLPPSATRHHGELLHPPR